MKIQFYSFVILVIFFSCKKKADPDPLACFNPNSRIVAAKDPINFQNCSRNYERAEWNFGDGGSSTISEPSHTWDKNGIYVVALKIFKGTKTNDVSKKILVAKSVTMDFLVNLSNFKVPAEYYELIYEIYYYKNQESAQIVYSDASNDPNWLSSARALRTTSDAASTYQFKFLVRGLKNSSPGIPFPLDSIVTENIDIVDGAKTPSATKKLSIADASYNITITYN